MLTKCRCENGIYGREKCDFCNGKGVVIPSLELKLEEVEFLALKIKYLQDNPDEHYKLCINYYEDLNEDQSVKLEANERIKQRMEEELNELQDEFEKTFILKDKINEITQAEISEHITQGYVYEKSHLDICAKCTNKNSNKCTNCTNNLQSLYIDDCTMNFQSNEKGNEWYQDKGFLLGLY